MGPDRHLLRSLFVMVLFLLAACQGSALPAPAPSPAALDTPALSPTPAAVATATAAIRTASPSPIALDATVPAVTPSETARSAIAAPAPEAAIEALAEEPSPAPTPAAGYTYQRPDGNRLMPGRARMPDVEPLELPLTDRPVWLVAAPVDVGSVWVVVSDDGRVQGFRAVGGAVEPEVIQPDHLPSGMPPLLVIENGSPRLIIAPSPAASPLTHPVLLSDGARMAYTEQNGDIVVWDGREVARLALDALPDARLLVDEADRLLLLTDATSRYGHGVLGDGLEAGSITLVETEPVVRVVLTIALPEPRVVEGIAPIWADIDGNGVREIIVTVSDAVRGAQLMVFGEDGSLAATGPSVGRPFRWRHQLVAAPFGPGGEMELAAVLTPHIGGVVEFYRAEGEALTLTARVPGFSSHGIGSRNLDMGLTADLDGDGQLELLVPTQDGTELGGIRRTGNGAEAAWTVPLGGRLSTNLAAVILGDGSLAVGAGRRDGVLQLWLP